MAHTDYTTVTDRIAGRLAKAAATRVTAADMTINRMGRFSTDGILAVAARIARQIAQQGLTPNDLDYVDGHDALFAIAAATHVPKSVYVPWQQLLMSLPDEWKHVVNAAARQLAQQLRRAPR